MLRRGRVEAEKVQSPAGEAQHQHGSCCLLVLFFFPSSFSVQEGGRSSKTRKVGGTIAAQRSLRHVTFM